MTFKKRNLTQPVADMAPFTVNLTVTPEEAAAFQRKAILHGWLPKGAIDRQDNMRSAVKFVLDGFKSHIRENYG